jgi:hypothetical protein
MLKAIKRVGWIRTTALIGWPLVLFTFIQEDAFHPFLRLNGVIANQIVSAASFLLPFVSARYALSVPRHVFTRIVIVMLLALPLCVSMVGVLGESSVVLEAFRTGDNASLKLVARAPMGAYSVAIYRADCATGCEYRIYPMQDRQILPGILLVRALEDFPSAKEAIFHRLGTNRLQIQVPEYSDGGTKIPTRSRIYELKPWVYS